MKGFIMKTSAIIFCFTVGITGAQAFADEVVAVPTYDPAVRLTITCNGGSYNTSGARSDMNTLISRADAFCRDQNKDAMDDTASSDPAKQKNCRDYTIKNLANENGPEQPGRACQTPDGSWQIVK